jgi:RHS repeat-associated protein
LQGTGGLEATILDADGTTTGVINDQFGNGVAAVTGTGSGASVTWNTTRVGAYGPLPGIQAQTLTDVTQLAAATAWRSRRIDPTGFYWLGARYYEPTSGRFLSADPMGHAASPSLYDFAHGDPVNYFDPTGRIFGTGLSTGEFFGSVFSGAAQGAGNYVVGLGQGAMGVVTGTANAVLHPVTTVDNVANGLGTLTGNLYYNTSATLSGMGNGIVNTVSDPTRLGNAVGSLVGGVALGAGAAKGIQALGTLGDSSTIFYSGGFGNAREVAESLAESTGGQTLATSPYAFAEGASQAEVAAASRGLAANASGNVQVVLDAGNIAGESGVPIRGVWATTEYPALMNNPAVTSLTYQIIDESGNVIATLTEDNPIAQMAFAQRTAAFGAADLLSNAANNAAGKKGCGN